MTRTNPKLKELPDHKHYAACLNRKLEIDDYCQKLFVQVCIYCVMMLLLTFFLTDADGFDHGGFRAHKQHLSIT